MTQFEKKFLKIVSIPVAQDSRGQMICSYLFGEKAMSFAWVINWEPHETQSSSLAFLKAVLGLKTMFFD